MSEVVQIDKEAFDNVLSILNNPMEFARQTALFELRASAKLVTKPDKADIEDLPVEENQVTNRYSLQATI